MHVMPLDELGVTLTGPLPKFGQPVLYGSLTCLGTEEFFLKSGALSFGAAEFVFSSTDECAMLTQGLVGSCSNRLEGRGRQRSEELSFNSGTESARADRAANLKLSRLPIWRAPVSCTSSK
jgi:hypothetical protein